MTSESYSDIALKVNFSILNLDYAKNMFIF